MITRWCDLSNQWLYMSEYFEAHKDEYMTRLLRVSTHNDWTNWIRFCLEGVVVQARDTEERCDQLVQLAGSFKERVQTLGGSWRLQSIVDQLFIVPVVQTAALAAHYGVIYHTARADVEKLRSIGILQELPNAPQKTYFAPEIIQITYDWSHP